MNAKNKNNKETQVKNENRQIKQAWRKKASKQARESPLQKNRKRANLTNYFFFSLSIIVVKK